MSEAHLGAAIHDLLDGRLSASETAAAMRHLELCGECRGQWRELLKARELLNTSEAGIDVAFAQKLMNQERMSSIAKSEKKGAWRVAAGRASVRRVALSLTSFFVILMVGTAWFVGQPAEIKPAAYAIDPPKVTNHTATTQVLAAQDEFNPSDWVMPDWNNTDLVLKAAELRLLPEKREQFIMLVNLDNYELLVLEQVGRLNHKELGQLKIDTLYDEPVYLINEQPVQVIWQAGDKVLSVQCQCPVSVSLEVAWRMPTVEQPSVTDRLGNGFRNIVGPFVGE